MTAAVTNTLTINDVSIAEGNSGQTALTVTITINSPAGAPNFSFTMATADGTATAGVDYLALAPLNLPLTGGLGEITVTINTVLFGDTAVEGNETFFVNITNPVNVTVLDAEGQVTILNDDTAPPLIANTGQSVGYTEQAGGVLIDADLALSDPDSTHLTGATVSIGAGRQASDQLLFTSQFGISSSFDASTGVLTLSGTATVAQYEQALRSVRFINLFNDNPVNVIRGTSGDDFPLTGTPGNDVIYADTGDDRIYGGNGTNTYVVAIAGDSDYAFDGVHKVDLSYFDRDNDPTNGLQPLATTSASFSGTQGEVSGFSLITEYLISIDSDGNGISDSRITLYGLFNPAIPVSEYLILTPTEDTLERTISWSVTDGINTSAVATSTVVVTTVNDAPALAGGGNAHSYTGGSPAIAVNPALTLTDPDSFVMTFARVSIDGFQAGDVLAFTNQNGITGSYNAATGVLTLVGNASPQNYQTALRSVTYSTSSSDPAARTINFQTNDGELASNVVSTTISGPVLPVLSVNDVSIAEGNSGTTFMTFTVSLDKPAGPGGVTFDVSASDGSATLAGADFLPTAGNLVIAEGQSSRTVSVLIVGDTAVETDETFQLDVTNITGATAVDTEGLGIILNDDFAPPPTINQSGTKFADSLLGTVGAIDIIAGNAGDDTIHGLDQGDTLYGNKGNDALFGDEGGDTLYGGVGHDQLWGGNGADRLLGEKGNDTLYGEGGMDTFVFGKGFGQDIIMDFEDGVDRLSFATSVFASYLDALAHAVQDGADVLITDSSGNSVRIVNLLVGQLGAGDFGIG